MQVEIVDIRKSALDGNLKAFADVRFDAQLIIKGFSVMNGKNGLFVSLPKKAGKDGRWFDFLLVDDALKHEVEDKVLKAYEREVDGARV